MGGKQTQALPRHGGRGWRGPPCWVVLWGQREFIMWGFCAVSTPGTWCLTGSLSLPILPWRVGPVFLSYHTFGSNQHRGGPLRLGVRNPKGLIRLKLSCQQAAFLLEGWGKSPRLCLFQPLGAPPTPGLVNPLLSSIGHHTDLHAFLFHREGQTLGVPWPHL